MALRFCSKSIILAAMAIAAVLAAVGLTQGWLSIAGRGDHQELSGEREATHDDGKRTVAAVNWSQGGESGSSAARLDGQRGGEGEAPVQLLDEEEDEPLEVVSRQDSHLGKEPGEAQLATRSIAKPQLVAGKTSIRQTERGPVASFQLRPTTTDPIGPLMIVAFLPPGSDAKILDLSPTEGTDFSKIGKWISKDGWFAAFQGTPQDMTNLLFDLSISQPAVATIKGNCGIEPFKIDLRLRK